MIKQKGARNMKCPKCSKDMEVGYLQWDYKESVTWVSGLLPLGLTYWKKDSELIQGTEGIGVNAIPSHICRQCKILLSEYGQK
jgi:hypothetical protein